MNEALILAYDLKHQIDLLPETVKQEVKVDGSDTGMTLVQRSKALVKELEYQERTKR
tara:strand:- start:58 stop:228 length:171 start_codon:yes stop_codon:yes gene_type:complete